MYSINNSIDIEKSKENEEYYIVQSIGTSFDNEDYVGDIIKEHTFDINSNSKIKTYVEHDTNGKLSIGKSIPKKIKGGIAFTHYLPKMLEKSKEVYYNIKEGFLSDVSIGFSVQEKDIEYTKENKRIFNKGVLEEISFVEKGCNPYAKVIAVKNNINLQDLLLNKEYDKIFNVLKDVGVLDSLEVLNFLKIGFKEKNNQEFYKKLLI